jgi:hypothetical protein
VSGSDCWAVGLATNPAGAHLNQIERWNGKRWRRAAAPEPGGKANGDGQQLDGVSCSSASDCWAVGTYMDAGGARLNEALRWNGKAWSWVSTPDPVGKSGTASQQLFGVACTSTKNCWAVGGTGVLGGAGLNEALHWNGHKWKAAPVPDPGGTSGSVNNVLHGISCVKASDCWAVGTARDSSGATTNQVLHWSSGRWASVAAPSPGQTSGMQLRLLSAVTCSSGTDCKAVGADANQHGELVNEVLRFSAGKWSVMHPPDPSGTSGLGRNTLSGVACPAAGDCWAVGQSENSSRGFVNQALSYNGHKWAMVSTPNPTGSGATADNELQAVACASAKNCWAVGYIADSAGNASDEQLHWNGRKWTKG